MLLSMGSQRVRHDLETERKKFVAASELFFFFFFWPLSFPSFPHASSVHASISFTYLTEWIFLLFDCGLNSL